MLSPKPIMLDKFALANFNRFYIHPNMDISCHDCIISCPVLEELGLSVRMPDDFVDDSIDQADPRDPCYTRCCTSRLHSLSQTQSHRLFSLLSNLHGWPTFMLNPAPSLPIAMMSPPCLTLSTSKLTLTQLIISFLMNHAESRQLYER
jgi:hypothetical protein